MRIAALNDAAVEAINSAELGEPSNAELDAQITDLDLITELAALPPVEYDRRRADAAKTLSVRASTLDKTVAQRRPQPRNDQAAELIIFPQREMWPDPVTDIGQVLDDAADAILSFMAMDRHWGDVIALWCLHTYAVECFPVSPRFAAESPTHECGKSTLLNIIKELVHRPLKTSNIQPAGIFRIAEQYAPTMIIDEGDSFLNDNEPLRGILNSGHCKGDVVIRVEGDPLTPKPYKVYGACAFGLIGELPATLQSRSIACRLKRATADEVVSLKTFRTDRPPPIFSMIAAQYWRWADDNRQCLASIDPDMGAMINRRADNWRVLFAIADAVGGEWPNKMRNAALTITAGADEQPQNIELLSDVRGIVLDKQGRDKFGCLSSTELLAALINLDSRPWADWKAGKPMTAKALAKELKPFQIYPSSDGVRRGYVVAGMIDAFDRYLPPQCVNASEHQQPRGFFAKSNVSDDAPTDTLENDETPHGIRVSDTLTDRKGVLPSYARGDDLAESFEAMERADGAQ